MEQYADTFETIETSPTIKEIEKRLRKLGCTKEQVSRHLEQVTKSRVQPAKEKRSKHRPHRIDWP
jgi:flagellar motor switch protein FliG